MSSRNALAAAAGASAPDMAVPTTNTAAPASRHPGSAPAATPASLSAGARAAGAEDGGPAHEHVGARLQAPGQRTGVDAAIALERHRPPGLGDGPAGGGAARRGAGRRA